MGTKVALTYLKAPGRGTINVFIDGTLVAAINASSSTVAWQSTWTSNLLAEDVHTVRFENGGGGWIDLDALQVFIPVTAGVHDDSNAAWTYSGSWSTYSGSGPYGNTLHQSKTSGNYAEVTFKGTQVSLLYLRAPGRGLIKVYIDGALVNTITASSSTVVWQSTWTSNLLADDVHTVRFENGGGGWIDLDAVQVQ